MAMQVVRIKAGRFLVGFCWGESGQKRFPGRKALQRQALEFGPEFDAATYSNKQFGFCESGDEWKTISSFPALCGCLRTEKNYLGLFHLQSAKKGDINDFWWLHLRLGGVIVEAGDSVFTSEEEARAAFEDMKLLSGLPGEIFDDAVSATAWLDAHVVYSAVDRYLIGKGHVTPLGAAASKGTITRLLILLGIIGIIAGGIFFMKWKEAHDEAARARQLQAEKLARKKAIEAHPEKFFKLEWQSQPVPLDIANDCLNAMMDIPLSASGWELHSAQCNGKKITVTWEYAEGADFIALPDKAVLQEGSHKFCKATFPIATTRSKRTVDGPGTKFQVLPTRGEATGMMAEITQATASYLSNLSFKPQEKKVIDKNTVVAPWHVCPFVLSKIPDIIIERNSKDGLFAMLSEIRGLTIEEVAYANDSWSVKGKIYARH